MGSGVRAHEELAAPLGRRLARLGVHLLTGGGSGVMESVSRAFAAVEERDGLVIGVLPFPETGAESGHPNPWGRDRDPHPPGQAGGGVQLAKSCQRPHLGCGRGAPRECRHGFRGRAVGALRTPRRAFRGAGSRPRPPVAVATARTVEEVIAFVRERLRDGRAGHERSEPGSGPGASPAAPAQRPTVKPAPPERIPRPSHREAAAPPPPARHRRLLHRPRRRRGGRRPRDPAPGKPRHGHPAPSRRHRSHAGRPGRG